MRTTATTEDEDLSALQANLARLKEYCRINRLKLNTTNARWEHIRETFLYYRNLHAKWCYCLDVLRFRTWHDLWSTCNAIVAKASKALGFVMQLSRGFKQGKNFENLWKSYTLGRSHVKKKHVKYATLAIKNI